MDITKSEKIKFEIPPIPISLLTAVYLVISSVIVLMIVFSNVLELPIEQFTADPAVTFTAHPLTGMGSSLGALMWCSAAVICFFSAAFLKINGKTNHVFFLFCSGLISAVLLFDDLFMFHEAIFPWYLHVPQKAVYAGYMLMIVGYMFYFRKQILNSEYPLLVIALFFFGGSVLGDFVLPQEGIAYLVEDGLKMFGIATWLVYFCRVAMNRISE